MPNPLPVARPALSSRPPATTAPPLWVWLVTGVGTLLGFILLVVTSFRSEQQMKRQFRNDAEKLLRREWDSRSDSITRVIVLGSSLVENGVADTTFFERRCGKGVRVVKLYRRGISMDALTTELPIFKLLERYPPDVLCIEDNLLLFHPMNIVKPGLTSQVAEWTSWHLLQQVHVLKIQMGWYPKERQGFQGFSPLHYQLNRQDTLQLSQLLTDTRKRVVHTETELPALYGSLRRLHRHGTHLVMLNIPRPALLETVIHGETRAPRLRRLITYYRQRYQMDYWQFNQPMPFRYFSDYTHLNYLGNPVYSAWLAHKICPIRPHPTQ